MFKTLLHGDSIASVASSPKGRKGTGEFSKFEGDGDFGRDLFTEVTAEEMPNC